MLTKCQLLIPSEWIVGFRHVEHIFALRPINAELGLDWVTDGEKGAFKQLKL